MSADHDTGPVAGIGRPASAPARLVETHLSLLVFGGDRVMKLLKPLDLGFVDHRHLEARRQAIADELAVNRRFAPDVYLDHLTLTNGSGVVVDHALLMRRLPDSARLAALLDSGEARHHLSAVARIMAAVHSDPASAVTIERAAAVAGCAALTGLWDESLDAIDRLGLVDPALLGRLRSLARNYLAGRCRLLDRRLELGLVRDGHGDLLADDIFCLDDGPRVLDALAFTERFRIGDVIGDLGFLAMDLCRRGHDELADHLLATYAELSGQHHPRSLSDHYIAYRALVRAKVAALRWLEHRQAADRDELDELLALCSERLERSRVRLVLVGGAPGSGKSTVARHLSDQRGWVGLSTDELRADLLGRSGPSVAALDQGLYRPQFVHAVYDELLRRARRLLELGESVVLDASWTERRERAAAAEMSSLAGADLIRFHCQAGPATMRERVGRRRGSLSDATPATVDALLERAAPWEGWIPLDTEAPVADTVERAMKLIDMTLIDTPEDMACTSR